MGEVILTMKGIDKSFPGVHALDHVDLEIRKGEVLALMGENGAGKSTLMKVLTGIYKKDEGTITYEGKEIEFENPSAAQEAGVIIVHQELNMLSHLTVAQNIFIGREIMKGSMIDDAKLNEEAALEASIQIRLRNLSGIIIVDFVNMEKIGVHPNDNTATVWMKPSDLVELIKEHGNTIHVIDI